MINDLPDLNEVKKQLKYKYIYYCLLFPPFTQKGTKPFGIDYFYIIYLIDCFTFDML